MNAQRRIFQLFVLLLPTQLTIHFWPDYAFVYGIRVDYLSPVLYLTDLAFLFLLAFSLKYIWPKKVLPIHLSSLLGAILFAAINIGYSAVPGVSIFRWVKFLQFALLLVIVKQTPRAKELLATPLTVGVVATLVLALVHFVNGGSVGGVLYFVGERSFSSNTPGIARTLFFGQEHLRPYATFAHPNSMAGFALVAAFLLWSPVVKRKIFSALSAVIVVLSFSANALIALGVSLVWYTIGKGKRHIWRLVVFGSLLLSILMPLAGDRIVGLSGKKSVDERVFLAQTAGASISQSPFLGSGLGSFTAELPGLRKGESEVWLLQPVHNTFLLLASEIGLLATMGAAGLFLKAKQEHTALLAVLLTGLFDHYWITLQQNFLLLAIVLGLGYKVRSGKISS